MSDGCLPHLLILLQPLAIGASPQHAKAQKTSIQHGRVLVVQWYT